MSRAAAIVCAAGALVASSARAGVILDNFSEGTGFPSTDLWVGTLPGSGTKSNDVDVYATMSTLFGGERRLALEIAPSGPSALVQVGLHHDAERLEYNANVGSAAALLLEYDAPGGLNADLASMGLDTVSLLIASADIPGAMVTVEAISGLGTPAQAVMTISKPLPVVWAHLGNGPVSLDFDLDEMPGLDLSDLDSLRVLFDASGTPALDFSLESIRFVPTPGCLTLALMGFGLGLRRGR